MMKLFPHALAVLTSILFVAAATAEDKASKTKLEGTYTVVKCERDGKAVPEKDVADCTVKIAGDKIVGADKAGVEFLNCTFTVDDTKKPWVLSMKSGEGKKHTCLCEQTADGLRIVYNMDGGEVPTEFKTSDKQVMMVLRTAK